MRIAVAGTCGLALTIAREIHSQTSHQLIILSRSHQPGLASQGYQCQVVDYTSTASLQHALMGVDTVISTVTGNAQLRLIEAAVACRVRRFAPAEFEGRPSLRSPNDALDRGRALALAHLQHYQSYIQSTVFVCGILYERFSVNGMRAHRIGVSTGYGNEGDYIVDARRMMADAPVYDAANNLAYVCLTSAYDVGRFVVRALDMVQWPAEMSMCGERMSVNALVEAIKIYRGRPYTNIHYQNPDTLRYQLSVAEMTGDIAKQRRLLALIATAEGRYDFSTPAYLNALFPDIRPIKFRDWFVRNWASVP
ncbi:NAD(P)-binding protein [Westerdykella ornata]|uniref:NAD(P)-binding protein n=1 Tax=Westerdykella ornata TaxID=318751 RepID=A0A6A6JQC0_WESOR|nr:NAD(P)-binding protein [Westerdykella ornata]KAF2278840.1 NAD(P)-binding protein [Westerdykella ornata]